LRSQLAEQRFCVRHFELASSFEVELLDHAILHYHGVALRTNTHAEALQIKLKAERFGEVTVTVGHHAHDASRLLITTPGTHHEGIIYRDAPDFIDAFGVQFARVFDIPWHVLRRAGGRESTWQTEDRDGLALDERGDIKGVGAKCAALGLGFDEFSELAVRQTISDFDAPSDPLDSGR
jgi:hypothetical protein